MDVRRMNLEGADPNHVLHIYQQEIRQNHTTRLTMVVSGVLMVLAGFVGAVLGFGDVIDFDIRMPTEFASRLTNASPGVVLMLIGLAFAIVPVIYIRDSLKLNV